MGLATQQPWGARAARQAWRVLDGALAWAPALLLAAPLVMLGIGAFSATWDSNGPRGFSLQPFRMAWTFSAQSAGFSLLMALSVALVSAMLAIPIAFFLLRSKPWLRRALSSLVFLPAVLPSLLYAMGLIMALPGLHGGWGLLFLAYVAQALPFAVWPVLAGLQLLDIELLEKAGQTLGASKWQRLMWLIVPNALRPAAVGVVAVFVLILAESSTSFFLASGQYQPFGVTLYNAFQDLDVRIAAASTMMLIAILAPVVLAMELWLAHRVAPPAQVCAAAFPNFAKA
ncbi:MAG TPA: ABC transporter permease subunit [Bordetella sp.]|nr:ABC transporter permease subunit [Bordetella sp.]